MPSQLAPLLRNEVAKAARRKLPYFGIFAVGLACVIAHFVAGQVSSTATAFSSASAVGSPREITFAA